MPIEPERSPMRTSRTAETIHHLKEETDRKNASVYGLCNGSGRRRFERNGDNSTVMLFARSSSVLRGKCKESLGARIGCTFRQEPNELYR